MAQHGIDVSNNQGTIDWRQVKSRASFAALKAVEGTTFRDATYPANRLGAAANGITIGGYAFAKAGATPQAQADYYLKIARPRPGDLWAGAIDMESGGMEPDCEWALAWCDHVAKAVGGRGVLYANASALAAAATRKPRAYNALLQRHGIWVAAWGDVPPAHYVLWQYRGGPSGSVPGGSCPGVHGFCDLDAWNPHVSPGDFAVPHPSRPWSVTITAGPDDGLVIARARTIVGVNARRRAWQVRHPGRWRRVSRLRYDRPA